MTKESKDRLILQYYEDDARELKKIVNSILKRLSGAGMKQYEKDNLYSIASEVFVDSLQKYDESKGDFRGLLYKSINNKIKSAMTQKNAEKRTADRDAVSLSAAIGSTDGLTQEDMIGSEHFEQDYFDKQDHNEFKEYLNSLDGLVGDVARCIADGKGKIQTVEYLDIDVDRYNLCLMKLKDDAYFKNMYSEKKCKSIINSNNNTNNKHTEASSMGTSTKETTKESLESIEMIDAFVSDAIYRDDHPLQRYSDQWSREAQGNLIATALHGYCIPSIVIAEQVKEVVKDGVKRTIQTKWIIDGKQRISVFRSFFRDKFRISKTVERADIEYQVAVRDKDGVILRDEDGDPVYEIKTFNIKGKLFSQFPDELKRTLKKYTLKEELYLNCSDDDIEYHIRRYNTSKPMNTAQRGVTFLGEEFAKISKRLAKHNFFTETCVKGGIWGLKAFTNGNIERAVSEAVMLSNFKDSWNKTPKAIGNYLKNNATTNNYKELEDTLNRLYEVIDDETIKKFTAKDCFVFISLFSEFKKLRRDDMEFVNFLNNFDRYADEKVVYHTYKKEEHFMSYNELRELSSSAGTKGNLVVSLYNALCAMMYKYFGTEVKEIESELILPEDSNFINEFLNAEIIKLCSANENTVKNVVNELTGCTSPTNDECVDILTYADMLDTYSIEVDNETELFTESNVAALLKLIKYVFEKEVDDDMFVSWLNIYVTRYEPKANLFDDMVSNLDRYLDYKQK